MKRKFYIYVYGALVYETFDELVAYEYARLCKVSPDDRKVFVTTKKGRGNK